MVLSVALDLGPRLAERVLARCGRRYISTALASPMSSVQVVLLVAAGDLPTDGPC